MYSFVAGTGNRITDGSVFSAAFGAGNGIYNGSTQSFIAGTGNLIATGSVHSAAFGAGNKITETSSQSFAAGGGNLITYSEASAAFGRDNVIARSEFSFAAGWQNRIEGGAKSVIFGTANSMSGESIESFIAGYGNKIEDSTRAAIFGSGNTIGSSNEGFIAGWENKMEGSFHSAVFGERNSLENSPNSLVAGSEHSIPGVNISNVAILGGRGLSPVASDFAVADRLAINSRLLLLGDGTYLVPNANDVLMVEELESVTGIDGNQKNIPKVKWGRLAAEHAWEVYDMDADYESVSRDLTTAEHRNVGMVRINSATDNARCAIEFEPGRTMIVCTAAIQYGLQIWTPSFNNMLCTLGPWQGIILSSGGYLLLTNPSDSKWYS